MDFDSDWVAIAIAAVLNLGIGFVWYSKWFFGPIWLQYVRPKGSVSPWNFLWGFGVSLVVAYFIEFFARHLGVTTVADGMFLGFCIWVGFVATTQVFFVIWHKMPWKLALADAGCRLLALLAMGGVIGA